MTNYKNPRQIVKLANNKSLVDFVDRIDTKHSTKNEYEQNILVNVNAFKEQNHKEKQATAFWSVKEALTIADLIISGRFKNFVFGVQKDKQTKQVTGYTIGKYANFGGGAVSRTLRIDWVPDLTDGNNKPLYQGPGSYSIKVELFHPIKTATGAILPDRNKPIDTHSISNITEYDMMAAMQLIKAKAQTKLHKIYLNPLEDENAQQGQAPVAPQQQNPAPTQQEAPSDNTSNFQGLFDGLDIDGNMFG